MDRLHFAVVALLLLVGFGPLADHTPYVGYAQDPGICDGSETPCDPDRPWMRGHIEKKCDRLGNAETGVLRCECEHTCTPGGSPDDATQGRTWDARCEARCNPRNCTCRPHPCEQT